ncbi:MAG: putative quinol monooxygenase [Methyloligellaceae bacterium]
MLAVVVQFTVKKESFGEFMPLMLENAAESLKVEPGCHQFDVCTDPVLPGEILLYEIYTDRKAFDDHLNSIHFQSFNANVESMVLEKDIKIFTDVIQS